MTTSLVASRRRVAGVLVPEVSASSKIELGIVPERRSMAAFTDDPGMAGSPRWASDRFAASAFRISWSDRERYHRSFESDSTFSGVAHCNKIHGKYAAEQAGVIAISSIGTTFAYCGKHSRDIEYLGSLCQAQVYETTGIVCGSALVKLDFSSSENPFEHRVTARGRRAGRAKAGYRWDLPTSRPPHGIKKSFRWSFP